MEVRRVSSQDTQADKEQEPARIVTNEEAQRTANFFGFVILGVGLTLAYWIWPAGAIDLPVGAITLGAWLRIFSSGVVALFSLLFAVALWS